MRREPDLREEWEEYLEQTEQHVQVVKEMLAKVGIDEDEETEGRKIVKHLGEALVKTMTMALAGRRQEGGAARRRRGAWYLPRLKDHANWELIGEAGKKLEGRRGEGAAARRTTRSRTRRTSTLPHEGLERELWIESLGMKAVLPPPEEEKDVKTAIGAARAKQARGKMLPKGKQKSAER